MKELEKLLIYNGVLLEFTANIICTIIFLITMCENKE